tara:strand:+ start:543 stop:1184 length:642 start_codon:yes stop_codon:yes gene_type:complete
MIVKEINQKQALTYIADNHIAKDGMIIKAINKLNCYVLHTINEEYYLKGNEKDLVGSLFHWTNKADKGYGTMKANRWFAAFEGTNIVGVQMLRWVRQKGLGWTGFPHARDKEVVFAIDKYIFEFTKDNIKVMYSEYSEDTEPMLTMEDFEFKMKYRKWADAYVPDHYLYYNIDKVESGTPPPEMFDKKQLLRHHNRRNFLKRLPDAFDEEEND